MTKNGPAADVEPCIMGMMLCKLNVVNTFLGSFFTRALNVIDPSQQQPAGVKRGQT